MLWLLFALLFLARHDLWWWSDPTFVLGLPIGLVWHLGICLAASILMAALTRRGLAEPPDEEGR